uniref:Uncharacterized protein n=1 Tax=Arundo donax TaxID=35708 RepID=A0A0A8YHM2_ARUDO
MPRTSHGSSNPPLPSARIRRLPDDLKPPTVSARTLTIRRDR